MKDGASGVSPSRGTGKVEPPREGESWTVLRMIRWSGQYLEEKGVEGGRRDAEHLLAEALGVSRLDLYLQFDRPLTPEELSTFKPLLLRRAEREPLQYVLGHTTFRELDLRVDRRALIPRPETEVLVGAVLEWARERWPERESGAAEGAAGAEREEETPEGEAGGGTALDVGTGTGAIALSLALEGPFRSVVATDRSSDALELAAENRRAAELEAAVELRVGSLYEPIRDGERFDAVVSNPPYVAEEEAGSLEPEIREWEPTEALFAGAGGLEILEALVRGAPEVLRAEGLLALELAPGQAGELETAVRETGAFRRPRIRKDLAGKERILLAVRR